MKLASHSCAIMVFSWLSDANDKTNTLNQQYVSIFRKEEGDIPFKGVNPHPVMEIEPQHQPGRCHQTTERVQYKHEHVNSKCPLFTDDSIIYREVKFNADCDQLQQDLNILHEWETLWGMSVKPAKCHIISVTRKGKFIGRDYTIKGQTLSTVDTITYLWGRSTVRHHLEQTSGRGGNKS